LEVLIAQMLAIHFCSDLGKTVDVLRALLAQAKQRVDAGLGYGRPDDVRIFWVNPPADIKVMNLVEDYGGRICGTDFMFTHALDPIDLDLPPMDALARIALADPMVGPVCDRARRIAAEIQRFGCEAVVVCRIPGASHCATEGSLIAQYLRQTCELPVVEVEVPSLVDTTVHVFENRIKALIETAKARRRG
jgi:hypothetical protein